MTMKKKKILIDVLFNQIQLFFFFFSSKKEKHLIEVAAAAAKVSESAPFTERQYSQIESHATSLTAKAARQQPSFGLKWLAIL